MPMADEWFYLIHIDLIQCTKKSREWNRFICCPEAIPMKKTSASRLVDAFFGMWVIQFSTPTITTGHGLQLGSWSIWSDTESSELRQRSIRSKYSSFYIGTSTAELLYGAILKLPSDFFMEEETAQNPQHFLEYVNTTGKYNGRRLHLTIDQGLLHTSYECSRFDHVKRPSYQLYKGPLSMVWRRSDNVYRFNIKGHETDVLVDWFETNITRGTQRNTWLWSPITP